MEKKDIEELIKLKLEESKTRSIEYQEGLEVGIEIGCIETRLDQAKVKNLVQPDVSGQLPTNDEMPMLLQWCKMKKKWQNGK